MREILTDIIENQPFDATEAARRATRPNLRKRFYQAAGVTAGEGGHAVVLDGRPVRTPARRLLAAPSAALAQALAAEWQAQTEVIDPAAMPLTRLANTVIDGVADQMAAVAEDIAKYLGGDLLFYRADTPAGLIARQGEAWDPVIAWARDDLGARFVLAEGIMPVAQPAEALTAMHAAIPAEAWPLGAVHSATTLTGSALLALALAHGRLTVEEAWAAAHVDEDWNLDQWGRDELALKRRAFRFAEMQAAAIVLALSRPVCGP